MDFKTDIFYVLVYGTLFLSNKVSVMHAILIFLSCRTCSKLFIFSLFNDIDHTFQVKTLQGNDDFIIDCVLNNMVYSSSFASKFPNMLDISSSDLNDHSLHYLIRYNLHI